MSKIINIGIIGPRAYQLGGYDFNDPRRLLLKNQFKSILLFYKKIKMTPIGVCGLNNGSEYDFAHCCLQNNIKYQLYLSHDNFEETWLSNKKEYDHIIENASNIEKLSNGEYSPKKKMAKDKFIIKHSDAIIYIFNNLKNECSILDSILQSRKPVFFIRT